METAEVIQVYVCPGCGSFYGSSSMPRLEEEQNFKYDSGKTNPRQPSHSRARCPTCPNHPERVRRYARLVPLDEQVEAEKEASKKFPTNRRRRIADRRATQQ